MPRIQKTIVFVAALVLLAFWTAKARAADVVRGHVESIATEESEFVMVDPTGKEWRFRLGDDAVIRKCDRATVEEVLTTDNKINWGALLEMLLGGKRFANRAEMQLGDLRMGDVVAVTYGELSKQLIALEVCVKRD